MKKLVRIIDKLGLTIFSNGVDRKVIIICPATGVLQSYYEKLSEWFAEQGYCVVTFDYYGIGKSKPEPIKQIKYSAREWGEGDISSVLEYVVSNLTPQKIFIMGHSIGGQLMGLCKNIKQADALILIAAQSGYWKFWKQGQKFKMWMNWHILMPLVVTVFGYFPGKKFKMENLPKGVALEWAAWCRSKNYLFDHLATAHNSYSLFRKSIISYSFSDDKYAPKSAVDWISSKYSNGKMTRKHFHPKDIETDKIGHFGILKPEFKDTLWNDIHSEIRNL